MTYHLYIWNSDALASYFGGQIIVCAESVEQARMLALDRAEAYISGRGFWTKEDRRNFINKFKADIRANPEIDDVTFVWGAD